MTQSNNTFDPQRLLLNLSGKIRKKKPKKK